MHVKQIICDSQCTMRCCYKHWALPTELEIVPFDRRIVYQVERMSISADSIETHLSDCINQLRDLPVEMCNYLS